MKNLLYLALLILSSFACSDDSNPGLSSGGNVNGNVNFDPEEWLIDKNLVFDGGPGRDGIPSIDFPNFSTVPNVDYLDDNDLVLGIRIGDDIKAYPHPILDWHEIVNDQIGDQSVALTYCPLTGTGIGWDRIINGIETTFGVSGLLYNSNLLPYDRATQSTWSQQRLDCVNGANIRMKAKLHPFVETTWATWSQYFPNSLVMNTETGFSRNYSRYPYGDYRTNNSNILFPVTIRDSRLPSKERVLAVFVDGVPKAYPFNKDKAELELISDSFQGQDLLIVRNTKKNYIIAFKTPTASLSFEVVNAEDSNDILLDSEGTSYDMLGFSHDGSLKRLILADQFIGFWFSWGTFYPNLEIYEQ